MQDAPVQHCQLQRMTQMLLRGLTIREAAGWFNALRPSNAMLEVLLTYPL